MPFVSPNKQNVSIEGECKMHFLLPKQHQSTEGRHSYILAVQTSKHG